MYFSFFYVFIQTKLKTSSFTQILVSDNTQCTAVMENNDNKFSLWCLWENEDTKEWSLRVIQLHKQTKEEKMLVEHTAVQMEF